MIILYAMKYNFNYDLALLCFACVFVWFSQRFIFTTISPPIQTSLCSERTKSTMVAMEGGLMADGSLGWRVLLLLCCLVADEK